MEMNAEANTSATAQASTSATLSAETPVSVSAQQAQSEIQTIRSDPEFRAKLFSKDAEANARWTQLHQAAYPEPADTTTQAMQATPNATQPNAGLDDAAVFAPPESPSSYRFDRLPAGVQHDLAQETFMREAFHAAGIPAPIGGQIDRLYSQAILNPPDPTRLEVERQKTHIQLEKTYGANAPEVVRIAQREFSAAAARPGGQRLVEMAERSGIGNSFYLINSLYNIARARGRA
jgi:hypothetical protein